MWSVWWCFGNMYAWLWLKYFSDFQFGFGDLEVSSAVVRSRSYDESQVPTGRRREGIYHSTLQMKNPRIYQEILHTVWSRLNPLGEGQLAACGPSNWLWETGTSTDLHLLASKFINSDFPNSIISCVSMNER